MIGFNSLNQPVSQYGSQSIPNPQGSTPQMLTTSQQGLGKQSQVSGMHNIDNGSAKHAYQYGEYGNPAMQPQTYPNPYYGGTTVPKLSEEKISVGGTLPYV